MPKYNRPIYHCLACGNVKKAEPDGIVPACCGKKMVVAAVETVVEQKAAVSEEEPQCTGERSSSGSYKQKS